MKKIRRRIYTAGLAGALFTSPIGVLTGSMIPPMIIMSPEIFNWVLIWGLFSQVVDTIILSEDKHHVSITTYNIFGFKKKPSV